MVARMKVVIEQRDGLGCCMLYGCCMGKVAVCCIIQQPKPYVRAAVWPPYSSIQQLFCCIAVWFAVWNDLMYGVYGVHVDPIQVG